MVKETYGITVEQQVDVEIDPNKMTEEWMADFREYMYPFLSRREHAEHISQLVAREIIQSEYDFVEGYGKLTDMGISFIVHEPDVYTETYSIHEGEE